MVKHEETVIDGYEVELELYEEDGEHRSQCYVRRGKAHASLACLADTGVLTNYTTCTEHKVHPQTIAAIERWAEENGY